VESETLGVSLKTHYTLTEYPKDIKFKYGWRKYQQRVLDDLQDHLTDGHLHVIAPPGSGKTVLGLEVAIRLNKPTLILAPTIAIRNQWIQRFCELFLQTNLTPDWISRDIRNPKFMTVVTYQGLHAACNNWRIDEEEIETKKKKQKKQTEMASQQIQILTTL
jgi:superfamily II DNA or RNA helicase